MSADVLDAVTPDMGEQTRASVITRRRHEIEAAAEAGHPGRHAEVAEMLAGRSYVLFLYAVFRDVRVVYVPPRAIGEFGGEDDNWMWPRHTGDFSFLRVYVAPDGSGAEFDPANVPYHPRTFLEVDPAGASEGDFVFALGYPGRTFRHRSSDYLAFEQDVRMPYVADVLERQVRIMEQAGRHDRAVAMKFDARVKGLANVMKNYRGKMAGLRRTGLVARWERQETALARFIDADPGRKARYGALLPEIAAVYADARRTAPRDLFLELLWSSNTSTSTVLGAALALETHAMERALPEIDCDSRFSDDNLPRTHAALLRSLANYDPATDRALLEERLEAGLALPPDQRPEGSVQWLAGRRLDTALDQAYAETRLADQGTVDELWSRPADALAAVNDPFLDLARRLYPAFEEARKAGARRDRTLGRLWADLTAVKTDYQQADFIPDANRTLRLTYGHVKGYSPRDGLLARPFTTVEGVVEKTTGVPPYYDTPTSLLALAAARDFGRFASPALGTVPVDLLYDGDTTGGSSGSPILNARGQVVGVNFDRVWEATINDYAWSPEFSRSIGVDIRYILWVTVRVGGATRVADELRE